MRVLILALILTAVPLHAIPYPMAARRLAKNKPASAYAAQPKLPKSSPCAEYGAGFVWVEGSSTCIRVGGSVGVGAGVGR
jgi:hypothetical protein